MNFLKRDKNEQMVVLYTKIPQLPTLTNKKIPEIKQFTTGGVARVGEKIKEMEKEIKKLTESIYERIDRLNITVDNSIRGANIFVWLLVIAYVLNKLCEYRDKMKTLSFNNLLDITAIVASLGIICFIVYAFLKDILGVVSLKRVRKTRNLVDFYVQSGKVKELKRLLLSLDGAKPYKKQLKYMLNSDMTTKELVQSYEQIVLETQDKKVHLTIHKYSKIAALANGASNNTTLDFWINLYCFCRILSEIAKIYQVKLGVTSLLKLLSAGCLVSYSASKLTNTIGDGLASLTPIKSLSWIITTVSQVFLSNKFIRAYGYWLKYTLRPVKHYNENMLKETKQFLDKIKLKEPIEE